MKLHISLELVQHADSRVLYGLVSWVSTYHYYYVEYRTDSGSRDQWFPIHYSFLNASLIRKLKSAIIVTRKGDQPSPPERTNDKI